MKLSSTDLSQLVDIAISAAAEAGRMIATSVPREVEHKSELRSLASQVVTDVDRRSEEIILDVLRPTCDRFGLGLLAEEQDDDGGRLKADYFWSVDPLDGTLPFIEGVAGWAVSIALVDRGGTPWLGVIHDPVESTTLHAVNGAGAFRDGAPWPNGPLPASDVLSVFADRSFLARDDHDAVMNALAHIADEMGLGGIRLEATAGAVMNACGVLATPPACYFKFPGPSGGGSLWDFAATSCLFNELGAVATDIHGLALDLNRADSTFMNHRGVLFATDESLAERLRTIYTKLR